MTHRPKLPRELPTLGLILAMGAVLALKIPAFREGSNLTAVGQNAAFIGILACGQGLVILGAGLDLSVGSTMALSACITAVCVAAGLGTPGAIAAGLVTGLLAGVVNGSLITDRLPVPFARALLQNLGVAARSSPRPPILTTLATLLLFRYGVSLLTHNRS